MMNSYLISIIIPVYNVENYLHRCLDSVVNQTYTNIEIILVDDGSKDSSGKICDEYALDDSRIIVIHKDNGGLSSARNAGLDIAKGDYIMFVDSDDYVEPQFCEIPLHLSIENNVEIVSFGFYKEAIDNSFENKTLNPRVISASEGIRETIIKKDVIFNFSWNKIYKSSLFNNVRYPIGKEYEDQATTYILFHLAKMIYVSDSILYHYVFRDTSISANWNKPDAICTRFSFWIDKLIFIREFYPENEVVQIKQLLDEAMKGFFRLVGIPKYRKSISMFSSFMDNNKTIILQLRKDRIIKLYYSNKYLFYLYCIYYRYRFINK